MALTSYERSRLRDIEAALEASDPSLAMALRSFRLPRRHRLYRLAALWLVAAVAAVGAVAGWWILFLIISGPLFVLTAMALGDREVR
jgi:ferric-dicitrate binding protein FerR (iron transport regulator)